ncbi:MAG TPA: PKD domain-containing protein [Planctomycetota bacterium]|nr:PKD domain-containing protein [Planctomycetota bacterium]
MKRLLHLITLLAAGWLSAGAFALERLEPASGCYVGFSIDGSVDSLAALNARLGFEAAVLTQFVHFPLTAGDVAVLDETAAQMIPHGGLLMITLEPLGGLSTVTAQAARELALLCAKYESRGIGGIMIRFAHEMNGPWYVWGQKPALYVEKYRVVAAEIHAGTKRTAMLWAPNDGGGYPYGGNPGPADFALLDTNGDGRLSVHDDPYAPYYPGDDAVDWVGLTLYHWGLAYPWGDNELPEPLSFADKLTGNYLGANGDDRPVPDFYATYCADGVHNKPMAIAETAAFYNTNRTGDPEFAIKQKWWRQVFAISGDSGEARDIAVHFPKLKMINWLEWRKRESEVNNDVVDWRVSHPVTRESFIADITKLKNGRRYFLTAADVRTPPPPIQHVPPLEIVSAAQVAPNPATVGSPLSLQFSARGIDPITYEWDCGDGTREIGGSTTHVYTAAGTYDIVAAARDGGNRSVTQTVRIAVTERMQITKMKATLRTSKPGRDALSLEMSLPLETLPNPGARVAMNIGGADGDFTLEKNGLGRGSAPRSRLQFKRLRNVQGVRVTVAMSANIASVWQQAGLLSAGNDLVNVPVELRIGETTFTGTASGRVSQKGAVIQVTSVSR